VFEVKIFLNNLKEFLKNYWAKIILILLILYFAVLYAIGIVLQYATNNLRLLNSHEVDFFTDGADAALSSIEFSPIKNFTFLFSNKLALPLMMIACIMITVATFKIFSRIIAEGGPKDKARKFTYSKDGTYGTAGWLTEDNLEGIAKVSNPKSADGYILGQLDKSGHKLVTTDSKSRLNKHIAVFGASGSGKSRCFSRNYIIQAVKRGESIIVTDPKGELFEDTAQFLRNNGYVVKIFNLVNPEKSDSWNCLKEIKGNEIMAQVFADTVIKNTSIGGKTDHFWDNSEMNLLKALILRVERGKVFQALNKQNMGTVYDLLTRASGEAGLDELFDPRQLSPEEKCCIAPYNIFKQAGENVRGGIILGLGTRLQVFQNEVIRKITEYDDIDLTLPGKRPCAYFCIMSDQDSTLNFLSSLFFSFLFIDLVRYADLNSGRCDVDVNFILDEFPNIGQIVDFTKKISTVRSRGINISVIFQAISQLQNRYPNGMWQEILGNCDTHLFLGCNDPDTAKFISDRSGDITIQVGSSMYSKSTRISPLVSMGVRESVGEGKRKLLTMDEVMRTPLDECLIIFRGQNALRAYKYDYSNHLRSKEFVRTYIRDYPSIFDKEKLLKEAEQQAKDENKEKDEAAIAQSPSSQTVQSAQTVQPVQPMQQPVVQVEKPKEKSISDLEKLKAEVTKNAQPQIAKKPKKDIFVKNTPSNNGQVNSNQNTNVTNKQAENQSKTVPQNAIVKNSLNTQQHADNKENANAQQSGVVELPTNKEEMLVGEIVLEGEIIEDIIEKATEVKSGKDTTKFTDSEKFSSEQFDKTENMMHNIEDDKKESSQESRVETDSNYLDKIFSKEQEAKPVSSDFRKADPVFGRNFTFDKTWKPGDVSRRTKERLEKQAKESSQMTANEAIKPTKNGLALTKKIG